MEKIFDIVIVGGSIIGSSIAIKLHQAGFLIKLIEMKTPCRFINNQIPDFKVLALNNTSIQFLREINVWQKIEKKFYTKFKYIETWKDPFFPIYFCSEILNKSKLGVIIENYRLYQELLNVISSKKINAQYNTYLKNICYLPSENLWKIHYDNEKTIFSRMIIGSDGQNSWIRKKSGIPYLSFQYNQACMLIIVKLKVNNKDTVWQSLDPTGPKALLPLYENWALLIWYDNPNYLYELQKMPNQKIEKKIIENFPKKLGPIHLYKHKVVPLKFLYGYQYVQQGLALVGDALHTIHPLAGQGANLGFRDIKILSDLLISVKSEKYTWNHISILKKYEKKCRLYNTIMQFGIDTFRLLFSHDSILTENICNPIFNVAESSKILKKILIKYASGIF
ncbi:2-octoprenyl-3-methyl-6-methoxy-1,4-benzoquinone hydroxylase [Wigglesworthia glossinidia endosymbiont of Glossina morsitans morsitans (Yale colony)]|uniref:2-octoprenyl-3-methyl-6-methoxy-1,4-benzoquinone hydroxylase n=1 Tax=Wigglesworthia glossinidia endosymbiont of Glossina morsitans morsitans (Yale colony) TaxID=1142511 RepID=H6Q5S7_WIGGL|nr:FAD-dependent monooxygenase [Wigglesworthia glossinidia]AFA41123.1 2-octoprenyl-3-methyl-6-methoxy-1,4-benzoquinone hydroxylase [Wigglesworthia glossinidia endosymbiont of Glossina morsitans morsitans (Yale colony)]